jgi:hypothetical protein
VKIEEIILDLVKKKKWEIYRKHAIEHVGGIANRSDAVPNEVARYLLHNPYEVNKLSPNSYFRKYIETRIYLIQKVKYVGRKRHIDNIKELGNKFGLIDNSKIARISRGVEQSPLIQQKNKVGEKYPLMQHLENMGMGRAEDYTNKVLDYVRMVDKCG